MSAPHACTIATHPFFAGMSPEQQRLFTECATERTFKSGEILFREGEPAGSFYLIQTGRVILEAHRPADGTAPLQELGAGEVLGWSWLFPPFRWHLQARAGEPTTALVLNGGHLLGLAERDPAFGYVLMKRVSQLLIQRLMAARERLMDAAAR